VVQYKLHGCGIGLFLRTKKKLHRIDNGYVTRSKHRTEKVDKWRNTRKQSMIAVVFAIPTP